MAAKNDGKKDYRKLLGQEKDKRMKFNTKQNEKIDYLTVQRLSATVEGKAQKCSRIRALTMVKLN